jgi:hypothetical protein
MGGGASRSGEFEDEWFEKGQVHQLEKWLETNSPDAQNAFGERVQ